MSGSNPTEPYPDLSMNHDTIVVPDLNAEQPPKATRKRWPWVLLGVVVFIALLVVVAEFIARAMLPGIARGIVVEQLDLPADQQLDVEARGVLLPQLIGGNLDELRLRTESVTFDGLTVAADVTVTGVPLRGGDLGSATGAVRIAEDQFAALLEGIDLPIDEVTLAAPDVQASASIPVLGFTIPVSLTVMPGVAEGDLTFTPVRVAISGLVVEAADVADRFGELGGELTSTQRVCIADQLPAGVLLTSVEVIGKELVIDVDVDGAIATNAALQENGTCQR